MGETWTYRDHEVEFQDGKLWIDGERIKPVDLGTATYTRSKVKTYIDQHIEGERELQEYTA